MSKPDLTLLIGPTEKAAMRFRSLLKQKAGPLAKKGIVAPDWNHVRLYAACAEADEVGVLRYRRGLDNPLVQQTLTAEFTTLFEKELPALEDTHVVLASAQLGNLLFAPSEIERLHGLLSPYFRNIRIVAHVEEQARLLAQHYTYAVLEGRHTSLDQEIALAGQDDWWAGALAMRGKTDPYIGLFDDIHAPPFWLDFKGLLDLWETSFGNGNVSLHPLDLVALNSDAGMDALCKALNVKNTFGKAEAGRLFQPEPAPSLARMRQMNDVLIRYSKVRDMIIPRDIWTQVHKNVRTGGAPIEAGSLAAVSACFKADNAKLAKRFPDLKPALRPDAPLPGWTEAAPTMGFRASQYLAAFAHALRKASTSGAEKRAEVDAARQAAEKFEDILADDSTDKAERQANKRLLNRVKVNHQMVMSTQFKPHNNLGAVNEEDLAAAYTAIAPRKLKNGSSGNVIVGCMKNEAPYIVEWVAYHRAMGVDNFLIYTNDCTDGTDEVLGRLMEMGVLEHRNNDNWKGNSPQQHALNKSLKEPLITNAEWIAHIDVDEFMNVRCGNGTLEDLFAAVPDATNIAMTWRLFGHNGVTRLSDEFVIDQFDTCAPKYCPKPHTVWGFKTMFRNIGAYAKISCHRPNKLDEGFENKVKWVNGSGQDMTRDAAHNGWRSSKKNVGYDLLQLNHYALRSAESFLIKRQRGRALHVDRSIGINYWIRMDWSDFRDVTIKRNIPRLQAEYDRLMQDPKLKKAHQDGLAWHKEKAQELHEKPEFAELYNQALAVKLDETERVAYALSLDMES
ncbi:glycosyltransferase family 2 protein [Sulfitobacter geojensis]|uniref:Glycosyltransferase family 2 protein n=1 Tax=Sulfitobacter geojensis TaxID=1342299 RepID=A0AAE3B4X9_9RHOB|nr:glycosyltransferase family 2 protein [Sulfitobacter geojensis]MBM1687978.1 glycosyltransferase family 2 protein [Sulfitobacter geojensis]MBM1692045.1 glycosyltransferase family 2 protein [Sulfitobacter geojensis]MBM1704211.1 glycosyltransferase family 2 protein [Sulfitobacter geojensis]MBM1708269.1 glycosyltransferase family 2 protein [Sulfitobacter geojensis]MBM1712334.1 glycosyltransferase family 2 protein [Sulfitobacter geojensis]